MDAHAGKKAESASREEPDPDRGRILREFETRWWRQLFLSGQLVLCLAPTVILSEGQGSPPVWLLVLCPVSLVVAIIGSLVNWRCPSCSSYLGKRMIGVRFCQSCGVPLS
jgi:hypothetical protein